MLKIGTHSHPTPHADAIFLLMYKSNVLTRQSETGLTFQHGMDDFQPDPTTKAIYCGTWEEQDVFVCTLKRIPKGLNDTPLRDLLLIQDDDHFILLSRARQLATWDLDHQFCARCGHKLDSRHAVEHTKICSNCNQRSYPRISPCVIVSIRKDDKILLARNVNTKTRRFSNIAGFVEAGETLEQAVAREVQEEVGIKVKNIRYHSSQPWSFPHQLMVGFLAEFDSGEISPAVDEIAEADWFDINHLPETPSSTTISGQIIDEHIKLIQAEQSL